MPTPFMHLQIAEQILDAAKSTAVNARLHMLLQQEWSAFYQGSIAPDFPAVCDVPRERGHFYTLPIAPEEEGYRNLFAQYPQLLQVSQLPATQAVFVAAYCVHLLYDMVWLRSVVIPYFFKAGHLGTREQRILIHFILLTYLDKQSVETLPAEAEALLTAVAPQEWLPFVADDCLLKWRNEVSTQLQPNATIRTAEIYAERLQLTPAEFLQRLDDPDWMQTELFAKLPVPDIQQLLTAAVPRSLQFIEQYLFHGNLI